MKTLNKYFVFSDVHGEYKALQDALQEAGYDSKNPNHKLISLGDNFDRGPDSRKIWSFLRQNKAICVKGNHDAMFQEYMEKGMDGEYVLFNVLHNGLGETIKSFSGMRDDMFSIPNLELARKNMMDKQSITDWLKNLPLYYETENFIFVHAGIDPYKPNWKDTDEKFMLWDIEYSHVPCINTNDKIVVIGHHHAFRVRENAKRHGYSEVPLREYAIPTKTMDENGRKKRITLSWVGNTDENRPYSSGNKIAIDGCTNLTGKVNVLIFEDYEKDETPEETNIRVNPMETRVYTSDGLYTISQGIDYTNYTYTNPIGGFRA